MNILSLRGGGIRGVATAAFLAEYESVVGEPCNQQFDMIAGTSTGAILAVGLGLGLSAADLLAFYREFASEIFRRRFGHRIGLASSRYDSIKLIDILNDAFSHSWLRKCETRVMVATTRLDDLSARFWKSWRHEIIAGLAAASSAAAPIYFDPVAIRRVGTMNEHYVDGSSFLYKDVPGVTRHYGDGGMFANSPALAALSEARVLRDNCVGPPCEYHSPISILDVACPSPKARPALGRGVFGFAPEIVSTFMEAGQDMSEEICRRELGAAYQVVKPPLDDASPALDCVTGENLAALEEVGRAEFHRVAVAGMFGEAVAAKVSEE